MKNVIHIYGASGSGTSTLGRKISEELGYKFMDIDDYFWLPTNPRYTTKRSKEERLALMKKDISENDNVVISGSLVDWGDELIPLFTLAIRLITDTEIRIERLKAREKQKFGDRIMPGGDMYTHHMEFIEWAKKYDTGSANMRSKAKHNEWQKLLQCITGLYVLSKLYTDIEKKKFLFVGTKGNIGNTWKAASELMGFELEQCCPVGYEIDNISFHTNIDETVIGKDIICTDSIPNEAKEDFNYITAHEKG